MLGNIIEAKVTISKDVKELAKTLRYAYTRRRASELAYTLAGCEARIKGVVYYPKSREKDYVLDISTSSYLFPYRVKLPERLINLNRRIR